MLPVTLLKTIRKDDNGNLTVLDRRYMNVELIVPAVQHSAIILSSSTTFYVGDIVQDLVDQRIVLVEYDNLCHRDFWDDKFYPKYLERLKDEGWLSDKPKTKG